MKKISKIEQMRAERKQLEQQIAEQKAIINEQTERLSRSKIVKEYSEIFVDSKNKFIKYSNLSETKKYFESNHFDMLQNLIHADDDNDNKELVQKQYEKFPELASLTSSQFHNLLSESVKEYVRTMLPLSKDNDE
tara:strand:- start:71 stop:475 length:405 start_codon:yes stop_codon:yes gene_type:complete